MLEKEITVNGLKFKAQLHIEMILIIVEIDNITVIVRHSLPETLTLIERYEVFNGSKPEEIAKAEYERLKPLILSSSQAKQG